MGVYIKGMKMPKNCIECPFSDHEAWCLIPGDPKMRYYCPKEEISEHCPLVEVSESHGRLIDADEICFSMTNGIDQDIAEEAIRETTTVIEAESE